MNKWIQVIGNSIERGEGEPPDGGTLFFVDQQSSSALVDGALFIDNKKAPTGAHEIRMKGGQVVAVDVDEHGKAKRREKGGVDVGTNKPTGSNSGRARGK